MSLIAGVGGIFFRSPDPSALAAWYTRALGFKLDQWGDSWGMAFEARDARDPQKTTQLIWSISPEKDGIRAQGVTFNYRVDDIDPVIAALRAAGVEVTDPTDDPYGRFAWTQDPDGNRVELWQPPAVPPAE